MSTPKQQAWIRAHLGRIRAPVMFPVGAGFNFNSGRIPRAPLWMQNFGLEWLHRAYVEPRLLRRYVTYLPSFALKLPLQMIGISHYSIDGCKLHYGPLQNAVRTTEERE